MRGKPGPLKGLESPSCVDTSSSRALGNFPSALRCTLKIVSLKKVGENVCVQEATPLSFSPRSRREFPFPSKVVGEVVSALVLHPKEGLCEYRKKSWSRSESRWSTRVVIVV